MDTTAASRGARLTTGAYRFGTYPGLVQRESLYSIRFSFLDMTVDRILQKSQEVFFHGRRVPCDPLPLRWEELGRMNMEEIYRFVKDCVQTSAERDKVEGMNGSPGQNEPDPRAIMPQLTEIQHTGVSASWDDVIIMVSPAYLPVLRELLHHLSAAVGRGARLHGVVKTHPSDHAISEDQWMQGAGTAALLVDNAPHELIDLGTVILSDELSQAITRGTAGYIALGEAWLTAVQELRIPGVVCTPLTSYLTRTWAGDFSSTGTEWFWVPPGTDMAKHVTFHNHPAFTLHHLRRYGIATGQWDTAPSPRDIYRVLGAGLSDFFSPTGAGKVPLTDKAMRTTAAFLEHRREQIKAHLRRTYGVRYDWRVEPRPGDSGSTDTAPPALSLHPAEPQDAVVVDWAEVPRNCVPVVRFGGDRQFRDLQARRGGGVGPTLRANWLFFLTPRVVERYNRSVIAAGRASQELISPISGHLDFSYDQQSSQNAQFPLFPKAIIACAPDGRLTITHARHSGGELLLHRAASAPGEAPWRHRMRWTQTDVIATPMPAETVATTMGDVAVITPGWYEPKLHNTVDEFTPAAVGAGRWNIVIVAGSVVTIRRGPVCVPPFGVVVSVDPALLSGMDTEECDSDGFVPVHGWAFTLNLHNPTTLPDAQWHATRWAYGGAYTLIAHGTAVWERSLETEQWNHISARGCQESDLSLTARHPRTVLSVDDTHQATLWVFSGRSYASAGVTYGEATACILSHAPRTQFAVNLDGGASSCLSLFEGNGVYEISTPALSYDSCMGHGRTVFSHIELPLVPDPDHGT